MTQNHTTIAIFGAGYVGLSSAVILANCGYNVHLIEVNPKRLKILQSGKSFFYEVGINELLQEALRNNTLFISDASAKATKESSVIFSCVGTPDNPDGSSNLQYVFDVADTVLKHAKVGTIFAQKSTVPVGTGSKIEELFSLGKKEILYVSNPEFLREGTAIYDTLWFDRVVVGGNNKSAVLAVTGIYKNIGAHRERLSRIAGVPMDPSVPSSYVNTTLKSAELTKVTANAFLALKISFANSIAKLADEAGADVKGVMDAVGADRRIVRSFLNAGRGFGGGCFPKDVSGLISSAAEYGIDMPIMVAVSDVNDSMPGYIANKASQKLGDITSKRVAVLGLAFKAGTSDARKSPGVKIANILAKAGAIVYAYDPHASEEAQEDLRRDVVVKNSIDAAIKDVDAVFVTTDWPEFTEYDLSQLSSSMAGNLFVDAMNVFDSNKVRTAGLRYIGVGRQ